MIEPPPNMVKLWLGPTVLYVDRIVAAKTVHFLGQNAAIFFSKKNPDFRPLNIKTKYLTIIIIRIRIKLKVPKAFSTKLN